jgi:hypothetical protein
MQKYVERKNAKNTTVWMNNTYIPAFMPGYEDGFPISRRQFARVTEYRTAAPNVCLHASSEPSEAQNCEAVHRFLKNGCIPELKSHSFIYYL